MLDALHHAWQAFWAIPHITVILAAGWALYLLGLGLWIVLQKREPVATISWLVSLAALPYLGFLVYLVFGPQKLQRHRLRRSRNRVDLPRVQEQAMDETGAELARLGLATSHLPPSTATDVRLLQDGSATYPALLDDIRGARDHIHLEYYIYAPDRTGTLIRDALVERARAGVKVRLLLDALGSAQAKRRFFQPLLDAGGELAWFHPARFGRIWTRTWINMRTHRKIVVIDGAIGYTGGINITDEENDALRADAYRDLHLRITGDVVHGLQRTFVEDWAYATQRHDFIASVARVMPPPAPGAIHAQVLVSGPDSSWEAIHRMYVSAIHAAKRRVWLTTPYFVPGEAAMMALTSAALGGLDVRVMVPKMSDSRSVTWAARSYFDELMAANVKVYEYGPRMLHSKALLVDDDYAMVGSANFDRRSFSLNFEVQMLFHDRDVAAGLERLVAAEFAHAPRVREQRPRPLFTARLPEALARLASPLL